MKAIHTQYEGKVQGVGFRASILAIAKGYEVIGWVKNLPDGRVELFASGEGDEVDDFLEGIAESHLAGHIESALSSPANPEAGLRGFRILG
jgi:acylphosphatase